MYFVFYTDIRFEGVPTIKLVQQSMQSKRK